MGTEMQEVDLEIQEEGFIGKEMMLNNLGFGECLVYLRNNKRLGREAWNKHTWVCLEDDKPLGVDDVTSFWAKDSIKENGIAIRPQVIIRKDRKNTFREWIPSSEDLLAVDWYMLDDFA